jgi:hypothetical protein
MHYAAPFQRSVPNQPRTLSIPAIGDVYFNAQKFFLTISEELRCNYSFDTEGRFMTGFLDGVNYRRGLKNDILMKHVAVNAPKTRRMLSAAEKERLVDDVLARVRYLRDFVAPEDHLSPWLDAILSWNTHRVQGEHDAFHAIYRPISILPPDQYLSVVVQAAEGCSWNKCTFCTFYRDRRFRIKSPHTFREHVQQVKHFLGGAAGLRKSLFLADANALIIPQKRLIDMLRVLHEEFPIGQAKPGFDYVLKGIYSFLDIVGAEKKTLADYQELREYGLKRIYIGLETGDNAVFRLLNKPGSPAECVEAVRTIKAAGINVGVILLAGAGGRQYAQAHVQQSLHTLKVMDLGVGDIVYVSPLVTSPTDEYTRTMDTHGVTALHASEVMAQVDVLKGGVTRARHGGPKVTLYHIEEFIY